MTVKFIKFIELFWIRSFNSEQKVLFPYGTSLLERETNQHIVSQMVKNAMEKIKQRYTK